MNQNEMKNCVQECSRCETVCLETVQYCLQQGGKHAEATHIQMLLNCAEICHTSARFLSSGSDLHTLTCDVCAQVCDQCAQDCEKFVDDSVMNQCMETCFRCADSCREMGSSSKAA